MPRIDSYLDNLDRHAAQVLWLLAGQPIQLLVGEERKILRKSCTEQEILTLVHEIMDASERRAFVLDGEVRFAYRSPSAGPFSLHVLRKASLLSCEISRAPGARELFEES